MKSIEDKWQKIQMPDTKMIDTIEQETTIFLSLTKEIENKQPFCHIDLKNYEQEFIKYKNQIANMIQQNNNLTKAVNNYAKIKDCQQSISTDIKNINKTINKYETMPEAVSQVNQLKITLSKLKTIQTQLESFDKNQLSKFEELRTQLGNNSRLSRNSKETNP